MQRLSVLLGAVRLRTKLAFNNIEMCLFIIMFPLASIFVDPLVIYEYTLWLDGENDKIWMEIQEYIQKHNLKKK